MEIKYEGLKVWFVTGSQSLYGDDALKQVAQNAGEVSKALDISPQIPIHVRFLPVLTTPEAIYSACLEANASSSCIGLVVWMHTFSPARMWIRGLNALRKPVLHLHTQFNRDIPWGSIDMDFMNLNQSAHGDREFGFIMSRMQLDRKIVAGHWKDPQVQTAIGVWERAAAGWHDWQGAKFARFGDNMRQVAVTEGDKVEAEIKFGYAVNGYGVGDLVEAVNAVDDKSIDVLAEEYQEQYQVTEVLQKGGPRHASLREAAKIELGLAAFLRSGGFKGFTDTFEDLHGLSQLPGIAVQRLMAEGYGFGGEGDWKTAALVRAMKVMGHGLKGGNSFMEDYTYHFDPADSLVLGAHMLEICPSIADGKPSCEIHPLGIGGKDDPVRLVFNGDGGPALNATMIDLGNRFRLLVNEVEAVRPRHELPKLPVARVLWKPFPDMLTGCAAWIYAGGAHHTGYSQNLTIEHMECFAEIAGVEFVKIGKETDLYHFKNMLRWNTNYYR
jgi:L-arabinose isomerase